MKRLYILIFFFVSGALGAGAQTISFVMFDNIKAYEKDGGVQIEWTNLTERDLYGYIIEHSTDGVLFDTIYHQAPLRNHNDRADYSVHDESPEPGTNFYRVRVSGTAGRSAMSSLLKVEIERNAQGFSVYPNPVSGDQLSINIVARNQGQLLVQVYSLSGLPVVQKTILYQGRSMTQTIQLPPLLQAGMYIVWVSDGEWQEKKIFTKK